MAVLVAMACWAANKRCADGRLQPGMSACCNDLGTVMTHVATGAAHLSFDIHAMAETGPLHQLERAAATSLDEEHMLHMVQTATWTRPLFPWCCRSLWLASEPFCFRMQGLSPGRKDNAVFMTHHRQAHRNAKQAS